VDRRAISRNAGGSLAGLVVADRLGGGLTGGGLLGRAGAQTVPAPEGASLALAPFTLGVSSGDPLPDSVVLWTRLAPDPVHEGGMPSVPIPVQWEVSTDERFTSLTQRGTVLATPEWGHSVHAEVRGLEPHRWYWYRFRVSGDISPVGRTRTAAAPQTGGQRLRMAFASCQMYEHGYFTAYRHLAEEDLDLVVHLGDYIYEHGPNEYQVASGNVRLHDGPEVDGLESYRNRHALYKTDPELQIAHGRFPWIVTWDDHEVDNNWAAEIPEDEDFDIQAFLVRRANAFQAYYEHMPLRRSAMPAGPDMALYRRLRFGDLAELSVLDTRQYRSDQACGDRAGPLCPEALEPGRTMTGNAQEAWLTDGLSASDARWNVVAQQVFMARQDFAPGPEERFSMDGWDGYMPARDRLLGFVREAEVPNLIVLTGDVHANWVAELKADFADAESATIGSEFVGTSITSGGDGVDQQPTTPEILAENPHLKFYNGQRGYVSCDITPEQWRSDYRVVPYVSRPGAPVETRASFVVEAGQPGVVQVAGAPAVA
jgi:alkaline phosphatase D